MNADVLGVDALSAAHGHLVAVREVSFSVARGEVLALVGANGAGKTTLLRTLAGVHAAASGRVALCGEDISALPAHQRVRRGLAMVPEGRRLFGDMSVHENLRVAGENGCSGRSGRGGRSARWELAGVLQALPALRPLLDRPAAALSGGQRQAAAIGRALMSNPELLLLDEVSLGLSPIAVDGVYDSLAALKQQRLTTLVLVEQDLDRALAFADRVLCLREGRIVLHGLPGELTRAAVTAAYFGMESMEESCP